MRKNMLCFLKNNKSCRALSLPWRITATRLVLITSPKKCHQTNVTRFFRFDHARVWWV